MGLMNGTHKKIIVFTIAFICVSFSVSGQDASNKLEGLKLSPWRVDNVPALDVLKKMATERSLAEADIAIMYENWDEMLVLTTEASDTPGAGESGMGIIINSSNVRSRVIINPKMKKMSIDTKGREVGAVLNELVQKHGSLTWYYDEENRIIHVVESHLLKDKRWVLNNGLGIEGDKAQTFQAANEILFKMVAPGSHPVTKGSFGKAGGDWDLVWDPAKHKTRTVRELLSAIIHKYHQPNVMYWVHVTPNHDPREGYEGLVDRSKLCWGLSPIREKKDQAEE